MAKIKTSLLSFFKKVFKLYFSLCMEVNMKIWEGGGGSHSIKNGIVNHVFNKTVDLHPHIFSPPELSSIH